MSESPSWTAWSGPWSDCWWLLDLGADTRRRIARHSIEDRERLLRLAEMGSDLLNDDADLAASA